MTQAILAATQALSGISRQAWLVCGVGLAVLVVLPGLASDELRPALLATLFTAAATAIGAVPVMFARPVSERQHSAWMGFSAGVMLAAAIFSLLLPAVDEATAMAGSASRGAVWVGAALMLGALALIALDKLLPHEHFQTGRTGPSVAMQRVWLFVIAIALHNLPEGLAVGVAVTQPGNAGMPLTLGMAVQNMPEGLVVALALVAAGYSRGQAWGVALLTGMVEPLGGVLGAGLVHAMPWLMPWALAFAAGAMLFVVSHEIIPESHRPGVETTATLGVMVGFIVMMWMNTSLA